MNGYFEMSFWSVCENVRFADRTGVGVFLIPVLFDFEPTRPGTLEASLLLAVRFSDIHGV
jgi:hypothetical protein